MAIQAGRYSFAVRHLADALQQIADGKIKPRDAKQFAEMALTMGGLRDIIAEARYENAINQRMLKIFNAAQGNISYADALEQAVTELSVEASEKAFEEACDRG